MKTVNKIFFIQTFQNMLKYIFLEIIISTLGHKLLTSVYSLKDLGPSHLDVTLDSKLMLDEHISKITSKANKSLDFI